MDVDAPVDAYDTTYDTCPTRGNGQIMACSRAQETISARDLAWVLRWMLQR